MKIKKIENKDTNYPNRFNNIKKMPELLYILGNEKLLNSRYTIGIVGSRNCSEYGRKVAFEFAKTLSKNGICIVSGMAKGIDAAAHDGAIRENGKTIAILGCGINNIYPEENEWLYNKIKTNDGCIISEYEPSVEANMSNFPKRNRLISALSDIVLVVEAEYRSGSQITANYAKKMGKTICAIPGNIDESTSIGTNIMLQNGAKLITKPTQLIKLLENQLNIKEYKKELKIPKEYINIYKLLLNKPMHINEITRNLKTNISQISSTLTIMEIEGYIEKDDINTYKIKE